MTTLRIADGLSATSLSRRFGALLAVDDVSLTVGPGDRVAMVGASGSGKTSVLRMLLAVDSPDSGEVRLDGAVVRPGTARSLRPFRAAVQYIPQDPAASLDPRRTVFASVAEPLRWLRIDGDHGRRARCALDAVEVSTSMLGARVGELSGGQRQRVAIARAIACGPRYLVADEPVSGLDLPLRDTVLTVIDDACARDGTALLVVTHDLAVAARISTRTIVLHDGAVVEDGATESVLTAPRHDRTRALVNAVPRLRPTQPLSEIS